MVNNQGKGLIKFDLKKDKFYHFLNNPKDKTTIPVNDINDFFIDENSNFWFTEYHNTWYYVDKNENFIKSKLPANYKKKYKRNKKLRKKIFRNQDFTVHLSKIRQIQFDENNILFSQTDNGVFLYNTTTQELMQLEDNGFKESSDVTSITRDQNDCIWMTKFNNGILKYSPICKQFKSYTKFNTSNGIVENLFVRAINTDSKSNIWIGTQNKGLIKYNTENKSIKHFTKGNYLNGDLYSSRIRSIFFDKDSIMWIGTQGSLSYYDTKTEKFRTFRVYDNYKQEKSARIYSIVEDTLNNFWLANWDNLVKFNKDSHKRTYYNQKKFGLDNIQHITMDNNGYLWLSAEFGGIAVYDTNNEKVVKRYVENDALNNQNVFQTIMVNDSIFWAATSNGLYKINSITDSVKIYSMQDGLPSSAILGIVKDNGKLWLTTLNGLCSFNPKNEKVLSFYKNDGLQSNEFVEGAYHYDLINKRIIVGGIKGITCFNPFTIKPDTTLAIPELTSLKILNREVNSKDFLSKPIEYTDSIILHYTKHKMFTLGFSSLHYNRPKYNQLSYQMIGFDNQPHIVNVQSVKQATYTNLNPGEYTFVLKASNGYGVWNKTERKLHIKILPAFYQTFLFKFIVILIIASIVIIIYRLRLLNIKRQKVKLKKEVELRTIQLQNVNTELEESKEEIEIQKETLIEQNKMLEEHKWNLEALVEERTKDLKEAKVKAEQANQLKSAFLDNMSHEIRTPMNAILGYSNLLNDNEITNNERDKFINIININGEALLRIIDDVLDISRIQTDSIEIIKDLFQLKDLIVDVINVINQNIDEVKKQNIKFLFEEPPEVLSVYSDYFRCKQILTNLLTNAFKYTEQGHVQLTYFIKDSYLTFSIKDSGIGIEKDKQAIIFDRFSKITNDKTKVIGGIGLGLAISKKLAELLGGNLNFESEFNKGSEFYFSIPYTYKT